MSYLLYRKIYLKIKEIYQAVINSNLFVSKSPTLVNTERHKIYMFYLSCNEDAAAAAVTVFPP